MVISWVMKPKVSRTSSRGLWKMQKKTLLCEKRLTFIRMRRNSSNLLTKTMNPYRMLQRWPKCWTNLHSKMLKCKMRLSILQESMDKSPSHTMQSSVLIVFWPVVALYSAVVFVLLEYCFCLISLSIRFLSEINSLGFLKNYRMKVMHLFDYLWLEIRHYCLDGDSKDGCSYKRMRAGSAEA
ncbi:unnamed protein product [Cylicostephanus goldi]|uniref:Uncharacterized protein n=1 Tax=Cylicostephanus goldi TaxID=71465 RepID=A0A3P6RXM2_CYLGO|nr:unnamed protein product [Cylicostephanus goldi]